MILGLIHSLMQPRQILGGGGPTPPAYLPGALQLAKTAIIRNSALQAPGGGAIADGSKLIYSAWWKGNLSNAQANGGITMLMEYLGSNWKPSVPSEQIPGLSLIYDNANVTDGAIRLNLNNATATVAVNAIAPYVAPNNPIPNTDWHHLLCSADLRYSGGGRRAAIYINGVSVLAYVDAGTQFDANYSLAAGFSIAGPDAPDNLMFADMADVFIDMSHSIVDGSGVIAPADIAKFISGGKPAMDPGADGSALFGWQPTMLFSDRGGADATPITTNRGYGGAFATLGSYATQSSPPLPAPFGPGGRAAGRALKNWVQHGTGATTVTSITTDAQNNKIPEGSLILVALNLGTASADPGPVTLEAGFTLLEEHFHAAGVERVGVYSKVAGPSETGAYTFTGFSAIHWAWGMINIVGADAANPVDAHSYQQNAASTNIQAAACSPTSASALLLYFGFYYETNAGPFIPPSGMTLRLSSYWFTAVSNLPEIMIADEQLSAAGSTGTRTATSTVSDTSQAVLVAIKPA